MAKKVGRSSRAAGARPGGSRRHEREHDRHQLSAGPIAKHFGAAWPNFQTEAAGTLPRRLRTCPPRRQTSGTSGVRCGVGTTRAAAPQRTKRDPCAHHVDSRSLGQSTHCRTVSRSSSDGRCGEPECLARGVRPVECTQKRTDIRHAKYEARALAGRAATLSALSQIEGFGQTCDGRPAPGQRADGLLAQDWQDALICIMPGRLQTFTAEARA